MSESDVQAFLLRKHGIRVGASMAEYVVKQLSSGASASLSVIGREARTGVPMRTFIALDEMRASANAPVSAAPLEFSDSLFPGA